MAANQLFVHCARQGSLPGLLQSVTTHEKGVITKRGVVLNYTRIEQRRSAGIIIYFHFDPRAHETSQSGGPGARKLRLHARHNFLRRQLVLPRLRTQILNGLKFCGSVLLSEATSRQEGGNRSAQHDGYTQHNKNETLLAR